MLNMFLIHTQNAFLFSDFLKYQRGGLTNQTLKSNPNSNPNPNLLLNSMQ